MKTEKWKVHCSAVILTETMTTKRKKSSLTGRSLKQLNEYTPYQLRWRIFLAYFSTFTATQFCTTRLPWSSLMNTLLIPFERKFACSEAFYNLYSRVRTHNFPTNTRTSHILHQSASPRCTAWSRTSLQHSLFALPWRACPRISQRLYDRSQCEKQRKRWICRLTAADHGMDNLQTLDSHRTTYHW